MSEIVRKYKIHAHGWWNETIIIEIKENYNGLDYESHEEEIIKEYYPKIDTTDWGINGIEVEEIFDDNGIEWI